MPQLQTVLTLLLVLLLLFKIWVLTVTLDNNTPDSSIVIAGTTDVPVGVFEFTATNEDVDVEDMTVVVDEVVQGWGGVLANQTITLDSIPAEGDEFVIGDCTVTFSDATDAAQDDELDCDGGAAGATIDLDDDAVAADGPARTVAELSAIIDSLTNVGDDLNPGDDLTVGAAGNTSTSFTSGTATAGDITFTDTDDNFTASSVTGVAAAADVANDADAIDSIALFYYDDGTAVKKTTGQAATVPTIDTSGVTGEALFQDLDLIIEDGESTLLEVRVDLKEMDDNDSNATARSGMTFNVALDLTTAKSEVRGVDSGDTFEDADITSDDDLGGGGANEATFAGDNMYVTNNKVIAELSGNQSTSLSDGLKEILKFTANSSGDNSDDPFLAEVEVTVVGTGTACVGSAAACGGANAGKVYLYNDDNTLIATAAAPTSGTTTNGVWTLTPTTPDEIDGGSEIYIIKADLYSDGADNALTATIDINSSTIGNDGITWRDGGTDGTDGVLVQWIDLGESDTSTTRIENELDN
jgi:hypothetical protein